MSDNLAANIVGVGGPLAILCNNPDEAAARISLLIGHNMLLGGV